MHSPCQVAIVFHDCSGINNHSFGQPYIGIQNGGSEHHSTLADTYGWANDGARMNEREHGEIPQSD
jgi:hypothetical protein